MFHAVEKRTKCGAAVSAVRFACVSACARFFSLVSLIADASVLASAFLFAALRLSLGMLERISIISIRSLPFSPERNIPLAGSFG